MHISLSPSKFLKKIKQRSLERKKQSYIHQYDFSGYKRFYHYHCRKTAGTSLAKMFLSIDGGNGDKLFKQLGQQSNQSMLVDDKIFVGWDKDLIEQGDYFFGFSHIPFDELKIPDGSFRFTSFRDPTERVVSHYRMLLDFSNQKIPHPCFAREGKWLGNSFDDFLDRVPPDHLKNQLFMFSKNLNISEAIERVSELDFCFFVDAFDQCVERFAAKTGVKLTVRRDRISRQTYSLSDDQISRAKELLKDEYEMLAAVRSRWQR